MKWATAPEPMGAQTNCVAIGLLYSNVVSSNFGEIGTCTTKALLGSATKYYKADMVNVLESSCFYIQQIWSNISINFTESYQITYI